MTRKKKPHDTRPRRHDDLVAEVLAHVGEVQRQAGWAGAPWYGEKNSPLVTVERPTGKGFIDVCLSWRMRLCRTHEKPTAVRAVIVEVKSELEDWCAGDVIRQLKGYRRTFDQDQHVWDMSACTANGCKLACSTMALFSGRELSASEETLLAHERVVVIRPTWQLSQEAAE